MKYHVEVLFADGWHNVSYDYDDKATADEEADAERYFGEIARVVEVCRGGRDAGADLALGHTTEGAEGE